MSAITVEKPRRPKNGGRVDSRPTGKQSDLKTALVFIAPAMLGFAVFYLYPTIRGFYFSMTQYNILSTPKWVCLLYTSPSPRD